MFLMFQLITRQLWSHLYNGLSQLHVTSVELLLQLHTLTLPHRPISTLTIPSVSVVEREVLKELTTPQHSVLHKVIKIKVLLLSDNFYI